MNISVVIPCYNEERNIGELLDRTAAVLGGTAGDHEIIVVDDGSTDGTAAVIASRAAANAAVRRLAHPVNAGYGAALRSGFAAASGDLIFLVDGDNQFDVAELGALIPLARQCDIVAGYRIRRRDHIGRSINSLLWHLLVRLLFGLRVRDMDCAFKLMDRKAVAGLGLRSDGIFISTELFVKAAAAGRTVRQVGVNHYPRRAGRSACSSFGVAAKAVRELFSLYGELKRAGRK